jgi:hypothetical protein
MSNDAETNALIADPDYSAYAFRRLVEARRWFEADRYPYRERRLEAEIQRRCAHLHEATTRQALVSHSIRYGPFGIIFGAAALGASIAPRLIFQFLEMVRLVNSDSMLLCDLWALVTIPVAVTVFAIGGFVDAYRVAKQFEP